jgi:hemolysin III
MIKIKDPISGISHLVGAILSIIGTVILIYSEWNNGYWLNIFAYFVFGFSMIFLYSSSAIYHLIGHSAEEIDIFRKIDHAMIYVLIAGTYTPICLIPLQGTIGYVSIIIVWILAIIGITSSFFKQFLTHVPRKAYTALYIIMGWMSVAIIYPLSKQIPIEGIYWLMTGGLFYTVGAFIYSRKKPNISKSFGFHELFHILILLGTICHFWMIYKFIN